MNATLVRQMSDGEELVLVEGQSLSRGPETDPRERSYDRRSRAMADGRRTPLTPTSWPPPPTRPAK